jgi:hypothetical protein
MPLLPNFSEAIIATEKLTGYCLNLSHLEGKHKAFLFLSVLSISTNDAEFLKLKIQLAISDEALERNEDGYGKRYHVDFNLQNGFRTAMVRTACIVKTGERAPRLTSCYII